MAELQFALLMRAASVVDKGGSLVYSTCSLEHEENEAIVKRFLDTNREFSLLRPDAHSELITNGGFVRSFPHRHKMDGFFAAIIEK
jgi:16S rRNA (cytosine967-C5)-methyltransferase